MFINCEGYPHLKEKWFNNIKDNFLNIKTYNPEKCDELEKEFCERFGVKYAATVNSGTTGIWASLVAGNIFKGDEIIISNYGFPAAYKAIVSLGAIPIPVELDKDTLAMNLEQIKNSITSKTKALIHVETNGWLSNNIKKIQNICKENNIIFIEDSCPSFGQMYKNKLAGTFGDLSIFSFSLHKNLYCGEGGIVLTNNKEYYENLLTIRYNDHNIKHKEFHNHNICLSSILANIILEQIKDVDYCNLLFKEKTRIHNQYKKYLSIYENKHVTNNYIFTTYFSKNIKKIEVKLSKLFNGFRINPYPVINKNFKVSNWIANHHIDLPNFIGLEDDKIKAICFYINSIDKKNE